MNDSSASRKLKARCRPPVDDKGVESTFVGDVTDLPPVQKLQYLKASLTGEAAAIVASVELNDKGYESAWTELTSRYNNKRVLLSTHMRVFLNSAAIAKPSSTEIKRLISDALRARRAFASLERPTDDDWFVHITVEKLDSSTRLLWEASLQTSDEFPTFSELQDFLHTRIRALDAATPKPLPVSAVGSKTPDRKGKVNALATSASEERKASKRCSLCQGNHAFNYCPRFKALSVTQRREHVKKQGACFNCLRLKHGASSCPSGSRCLRCQGKHHTMLHNSDESSPASTDTSEGVTTTESQAKPKDAPSTSAIQSNVAALTATSRRQILLSTALATCSSADGRSVVIRALLDSGSEATFVSERVAQALRLPRRRVRIPLSGIQGASSGVVCHSVDLTLGSPRDAELRVRLPAALVLPKLTSTLPSRRVTRGDWPHLDGLALADPRFDQPAGVDAILGADAYGILLREGLKTGPAGVPCAQATALGWVLMGQASKPEPTTADQGVSALHVATADVDLNRALQRFWALEELETAPISTPEDDYCESLFATTHTRDTRGRYTLRLPRRRDPPLKLGNNRREALNIFVRSESRLRRNPCIRRMYTDFMDEYKTLGHMKLVPASEQHREDAYYLPHHAVFKTTDVETKIRVVFNASHRTHTGVSLNDTLLAGPKLQSELWLILSRWRLYRYAFTSDIVKMFRQIRVHPEDVDLQRILWRSDPTAEVQDFRLTTVVYGTTSAPYMALRTLKQLADDERVAYPLGADAIDSQSYVDDILAGGHTLEDAMEVQRQLVALLAAGGFQLSKWAANAPELCPDGQASDKLFHAREGVSTLGVLWSPSAHCLSLRVAPPISSNTSTKRSVLSVVARLFDPLGWAAPVLVYGKIFIQDLWVHGLSWDQPLPTELQTRWTKFADSLPRLNKLHTPRSINYYGKGTAVEVHGFSDASSRAYAAAVYIRTMDADGNIRVSLLVAKTKVIHACVRCARFRGVAAEQQMGQLPAERTQAMRPFRISGVDYAGPIQMCASMGRGHKTVKGYICLFVCLASKAVHLEPVSSLTSVSFLAAFRRFTSRRGHCQQLISDNGTNFRGAAKELASMFRAASDFYKESVTSLANDGTTWSFIPPGAPHFGGLWEAGVKSAKYHLRRVIGEHPLSYEDLATVLTQVEACLNSRPLYALSNDPSYLSALTPGHLLIGEPLVNVAEYPAQDDNLRRLTNRWALTSAMRDHFWKRWSTEYLHHLQQLRKWMKPASNLSVGDLVLIKSELQPPAKWALARVTALHPGPDGLVRVVSLKTVNSILKRPVTKLCPLPLEPTPVA